MLRLEVPIGEEQYDEETNKFFKDCYVLELEHSLASVSKWESNFEKPFLSPEPKTNEETRWYVKAMTLTPKVPEEIYDRLTQQNVEDVNTYINRKMTATWFTDLPGSSSSSGHVMTAEIFYYMMFSLGIPLECENWHLTRLTTLIRVFDEKNKPKKKMSAESIAERNRRLNAERKAKYGTSG